MHGRYTAPLTSGFNKLSTRMNVECIFHVVIQFGNEEEMQGNDESVEG